MDFSLDDNLPIGLCSLYYSKPGVGKTSSFATLAEALKKKGPIKIYYTEERNPLQPLMAAYPELKDVIRTIIFTRFDTFDEYLDDINQLLIRYEKGERPYAAIGCDSITFIQQLFKTAMEDDRFDDRLSDGKRSNLLIDRFRVEMSDWGGLGSMMKRFTKALQSFSADYGVPVVCMGTLAEYPSYNKAMEAAPAFQGKDYSDSFTGYFDFIGLVRDSDNEDRPYPPHVSYKSKHDDFIAKSVSRTLNEKQVKFGYVPLDFRKILKAIDEDIK